MRFIRLVIALFLTAGLGFSTTIIVNNVDNALGYLNTVWIDENGTPTQLYWIGGIDITVAGHSRVAWCVQLFVDIGLSTYNTVVDWADTATLDRVGWLVNYVVPTITAMPSGAAKQTAGAAMQLAIWDIVEDNGDGLAVGHGKVTVSTDSSHQTNSSLVTQAQAYETQSLGQSYPWVPVYHNTDRTTGVAVQNLIGPRTNDGGPDSVAAEPQNAVLIVGGLILLIAGRWKRSRKAA